MEYLVPRELGTIAVKLWRQPLHHALKVAPQRWSDAIPATGGERHKIIVRTER
jgi:hypothetical protein